MDRAGAVVRWRALRGIRTFFKRCKARYRVLQEQGEWVDRLGSRVRAAAAVNRVRAVVAVNRARVASRVRALPVGAVATR